MSTTRSLTIGRLPIAEITGTCPASTIGSIRSLQARTARPSMRIPHEPQIIIRQLLRKDSVPSTWSLTMSSTSSRHDHSGPSTSYSLSARSPLSASYRQILRATSIRSVLPLLGLPFRRPHRLPVQHGPVSDPPHDRVPHVVLVVAAGEIVRARVCAAALLPREPGLDHAVRELEQEAELERLGQIAVEDVALVLDDHALEALAQAGDDVLLLEHLLHAAEDAEVLCIVWPSSSRIFHGRSPCSRPRRCLSSAS